MKNTETHTPVSIALAVRYGLGARVDVVPRWRGVALCVHAPISDGAATPKRGVWTITSHEFGYAAGTFHGPLSGAVRLARLWDTAFHDALASAPRVGAAVPSLSRWNQARAWSRQVTGDAPPTGPVASDHGDYRRDADAADNGRRIGDDGPVLPVISQRRETVAAADGDGAEQFPAALTMTRGDAPRTVRYARRLPDGRDRLRDPETGRGLKMNGDVAAFADGAGVRLRLWFDDAWRDVPTIAECMEWSLDGIAETPDGSRVEPDAPSSWLRLLGVI